MTWKKLYEMVGAKFEVKKILCDSKKRTYFLTKNDEAFYPPLWIFEDWAESNHESLEEFVFSRKFHFSASENEGKRTYTLYWD